MTGENNEHTLRQKLAEQYRELGAVGLNELSSGNVSCRIGDDMLISPSGASANTIDPEVVVRMSLDGEWQGNRKPSSEWRMHAAIYKNTRASAVVHTHSDYCVAVACKGQNLPGFHYLVGTFGGSDVPCTTYYTFGSQELADSAADALQNRKACLLGSHGMICRGRSLEDAASLAHRLEIMCKQYVLAKQVGEPYILTDEEWQDFFDRAQRASYGKYI